MKPNLRYQRTMRRLNWVSVGANGCGAALTFLYYNIVFSGRATKPPPYIALYLGVVILISTGLFVLAGFVSQRLQKPLLAWYRQATEHVTPEPAPPDIRRLALNLPVTAASITLGIWVLAGFVFGALNGINLEMRQFDWARFGEVLLGTIGIAGPTTTVLSYFAAERAWQPEIPLFFAGQDLTQIPAFRLTVRWKLLVLFAMGAIPLLLLSILSYSYAAQIAHAPQPASLLPTLLRLNLFLAGTGILVAVVLARTLGASLVESLEKLGRRLTTVREGNLDEHMEVTSNDEIGVLSAHFNSMVEGLRSRNTELQTIYQISQDISASLELNQTLQAVLNQVQRIIPYDGAEICLYDEAENVLRVRAWARSDRAIADTRGRAYRLGEGFTGWVGQQRQSLLVPDIDAQQGQRPVTRQVADGVILNSYLGVPLVANRKMVGTLELVSVRKGAFDEHARQLVETIAPQAAIAIGNAAQVLERERLLKEQIEQLRIEVDEAKKARQVAEITGTEYFQQLQEKARQMRTTPKSSAQGQAEP